MQTVADFVNELLTKTAFAPGSAVAGAPGGDPAAAGGAPMDPSMGGGMPPADPSMGGQDPMMIPLSSLTVGDFAGLMSEILGQVMGGGMPAEGEAPEGGEKPAEPKGDAPDTAESGDKATIDRLDQIISLLGGTVPGMEGDAAAGAAPAGPMAGAVDPAAAPMDPAMAGGAPKMASVRTGNESISDLICRTVAGLKGNDSDNDSDSDKGI